MSYKKLSDEDLQEIAMSLSVQLTSAMRAWEISMRGMRVDSREYKSICAAGKKVQTAYIRMKFIAEQRWDDKKVNMYFTQNNGCSFN